MKKLLALAAVLCTSPVFAQTQTVAQKTEYRPFRYETACAVEKDANETPDTCVVIETREKGGALRSRNIFSGRYGLTIKLRFDKEKGFVTWDSFNKFEYKWDYKVGGNGDLGAWTYVMPGFLVQNISWE